MRELRIDAELTVRTVALRMRSFGPIVSRIERGKHAISVETVQRYARALDLDIGTVLVCLDPTWPGNRRVIGHAA